VSGAQAAPASASHTVAAGPTPPRRTTSGTEPTATVARTTSVAPDGTLRSVVAMSGATAPTDARGGASPAHPGATAPVPTAAPMQHQPTALPGLTRTGRATTQPLTLRSSGTEPSQSLVSATRPGDRPQTSSREPLAAPAGPPSPVPAAPVGVAGASGGSGFFFSGVAALLALPGLRVPALIGGVRTTVMVDAPQPLLRLPERPG